MTKKNQGRLTVKTYTYEWETADEIIANMNTKVKFPTYGIGTLAGITGVTNPDTYRKAHELWLKLKAAFNAEAAGYNPDLFFSRLGSVGKVDRREVLRSAWWELLDGDSYGDYDELTRIIEILHGNEKLETGRILFGS